MLKCTTARTFLFWPSDRISSYYKDPSEITIVKEFLGAELAGLAYEPMFDYFKNVSPDFFRVTEADFVSTEDGTGIVHIAPAFGEDDFGVGQKLGLPIVCPVDEEGKFTQEAPNLPEKPFTMPTPIIRLIKGKNRLIHRATIQHRYPFCYRCDTALIYKAITTWFMKIGPLKANMLENNGRINWVPSHLKTGRFGKGIESAPDWNISATAIGERRFPYGSANAVTGNAWATLTSCMRLWGRETRNSVKSFTVPP